MHILSHHNARNGIIQAYKKPLRCSTSQGHGRNLLGDYDMAILPHAPGVYRITCLPSQKVYIGSTNDLARRWTEHRKMLRGGRHPNIHLQSAWNKYGESQFIYEVLELILASFVTEREQYWIDRLHAADRRYGFNNAPVADPPAGYRHTTVARAAMARGHDKVWSGFIDPEGTEVVITGLLKFCKSHGLSYHSMISMAHGRSHALQHKGWTHYNAARPRQQFKDLSGFIRPDGTQEPTPLSVQDLARDNGLNWKSLYKLISGDYKTHKGWRYVSK